jgi:hypothetical protein
MLGFDGLGDLLHGNLGLGANAGIGKQGQREVQRLRLGRASFRTS